MMFSVGVRIDVYSRICVDIWHIILRSLLAGEVAQWLCMVLYLNMIRFRLIEMTSKMLVEESVRLAKF